MFYNEFGNPDGCKSEDLIDKNIDKYHMEDKLIIMVERGGCTFSQKARNVQKVGGDIALVIDNTNEDLNKLIMSDDGSGAGLRVPSVMISKKDG